MKGLTRVDYIRRGKVRTHMAKTWRRPNRGSRRDFKPECERRIRLQVIADPRFEGTTYGRWP